MKYIVVDVEADGPVPGTDMYSMISFGAVVVNKRGVQRDLIFHGKVCPISNNWDEQALRISNTTREEHVTYPQPHIIMKEFDEWVRNLKWGKPVFISDNLAFDWQFINYYFHRFVGENPFGYSGQRIGDKFQGYFNNNYYKWKEHRTTEHDHNPVNDAISNAEALWWLKEHGYKLI